MFLRAGFNRRNRTTGISAFTFHERSGRGFRWSELRIWKCGDLFWLGYSRASGPVWGIVLGFRNLIGDGLMWPERHALPKSEVEK